ncbi:MAG: bifunctional phosphoribosylaminoimidazolecarboxamide formyltransferase/IMP cyclohydrolase [Dehalococcoidia bacterium]|nr:bifunctional phosphoribosylaminoimidazolecarboxamide formyltransferase/IMP cyclohydrolase [Dehalococcoidia bacterium]MDW8119121.1 bifunctional phosphoribosylaminoimidazolecarboxamide formyltransferase/IMP cyclohydrolase [Chloroflexota bacterium]
MRALVSVSDKRGVVDLARRLHQAGVSLISTGGTARLLSQEGIPVQQVSDLTRFPELLDGRVKTLHPVIHAGILARRDKPEHMAELGRRNLVPIDIVVVNLYPFEATIQRPDVPLDEALEQIDIGGPTLLRAAAKNFPAVVPLCDPTDYSWVGEKVVARTLTLAERRALAAKAFQHVALYDTIIARWLRGDTELFPAEMTFGGRLVQRLRYGENPHQQGALYAWAPVRGGIAQARQLHGKELSYNNILDASAAWEAVNEWTEPACVIVKHTNPCGLAVHADLVEAYRRAYAGDPVSAYGGIVGFNRVVSSAVADAMRGVFYEVVVAPGYTSEALAILTKRRDLRILEVPTGGEGLEVRTVSGGFLVQTADTLREDTATWKVVTQRPPTPAEWEDLTFAWGVVKHVKSNAIVLVKDKALVGMGAGQPNRVTSVRLAVQVAGARARGSVLASDAFFPFPDGVEAAAEGGVTAIIQPGGSIRDADVIAAADRLGLAMVCTGVRHFRH